MGAQALPGRGAEHVVRRISVRPTAASTSVAADAVRLGGGRNGA
ncbi:hypothetical protein [Streptomyces sp. NPDC057280]